MTEEMEISTGNVPVGRFAPSPTGRMHLGNMFTALLSWLSVRSKNGKWILRIEDLDPQRSKDEYAHMIEDDLAWLGLDFDEGGMSDKGPHGPYRQSLRNDIYEDALHRLKETGLTYPCLCTRADIMSTQAPHQNDGRIIYSGHCRPATFPNREPEPDCRHTTRLYAPDKEFSFDDRVYGRQNVNLATSCGDFVLRRADGAWAYQLAVVVDDASMGVTEVVRGNDLLLSAAQQLYLYDLLGLNAPAYAHLPLICNSAMQRLSKRDASLNMGELRKRHSPEEIIGLLGFMANLLPDPTTCTAKELIPLFSWDKIPCRPKIIVPDSKI